MDEQQKPLSSHDLSGWWSGRTSTLVWTSLLFCVLNLHFRLTTLSYSDTLRGLWQFSMQCRVYTEYTPCQQTKHCFLCQRCTLVSFRGVYLLHAPASVTHDLLVIFPSYRPSIPSSLYLSLSLFFLSLHCPHVLHNTHIVKHIDIISCF